MKNIEVENEVKKCRRELKNISNIKKVVGDMSPIMIFLTRYSLIKACGTIEYSFKSIIADFSNGEKEELQNYLTNKIRNNSQNPTYQNILNSLGDFSENWKEDFKQRVQNLPKKDELLLSLSSLNSARNDFAHGGEPSITFNDVKKHFENSCIILEELDDLIYEMLKPSPKTSQA